MLNEVEVSLKLLGMFFSFNFAFATAQSIHVYDNKRE